MGFLVLISRQLPPALEYLTRWCPCFLSFDGLFRLAMDCDYVIVNPQGTGLLHFIKTVLFNNDSTSFVVSSPSMQQKVDDSWTAKLSFLMMKLMLSISVPLAKVGEIIEGLLNIISANGGVRNMTYKLLTGQGVEIPHKDSLKYWTIIGQLDPRLNLISHVETNPDYSTDGQNTSFWSNAAANSRTMADLCMMASKLAYENRAVIQHVVRDKWHMQNVEVHNCWNEHRKDDSTRVTLFKDRKQDARVLVVAFKGTEPFTARDWNIDLDFSWFEIPGLGRIHVGFLEALGLGNRNDLYSFMNELNKDLDSSVATCDGQKNLAYRLITRKIEETLDQNPNAKLLITGHSLGGALAVALVAVLFYKERNKIMNRLTAVYTFGQPRVGDSRFAAYMEKKLNEPVNRCFRIVYGNDIVPRVPFDNRIFGFRHISPCFYFNMHYEEQTMKEQPNKNYFPVDVIATRVVAMCELFQSFFLKYMYGDGYQESMTSTAFRIAGLFVPGVAGHSPVNYVNSIQLGPELLDSTL